MFYGVVRVKKRIHKFRFFFLFFFFFNWNKILWIFEMEGCILKRWQPPRTCTSGGVSRAELRFIDLTGMNERKMRRTTLWKRKTGGWSGGGRGGTRFPNPIRQRTRRVPFNYSSSGHNGTPKFYSNVNRHNSGFLGN